MWYGRVVMSMECGTDNHVQMTPKTAYVLLVLGKDMNPLPLSYVIAWWKIGLVPGMP